MEQLARDREMRVLIIGCGYVGLRLGRLFAKSSHAVFGLRRGHSADAEMKQEGITPVHGDISDRQSLAAIDPAFDIVVNLASSSKGGVNEYRQVYLEGARNVLRWLRNSGTRCRRYIQVSSTSVYAQTDGSWVTEESATEPKSDTSKVLVETEAELLRARDEDGFPATIVRASGIYGPGRGHLFKQFLKGEATLRDQGESWINMIHVDDLAGAIFHLATQSDPLSAIYNATDNEPVTQREFFGWLAHTLNRSLPPSAPSDPDRKRGLTNKRVSNARLKASGFRLAYPTFREGYGAELQRLGIHANVAGQQDAPLFP